MEQGHKGFYNSARIVYGLATDGLQNKKHWLKP